MMIITYDVDWPVIEQAMIKSKNMVVRAGWLDGDAVFINVLNPRHYAIGKCRKEDVPGCPSIPLKLFIAVVEGKPLKVTI